MCLSSTYFTYQHEFYKQKQGAAMGSPISLIVANLYTAVYMEQFDSRALEHRRDLANYVVPIC